MQIQENVSLKVKTTMRIGGTARFFALLESKADTEEAVKFARKKEIPLIVLGGGSNTVFADGTIEALVVKITASQVKVNANQAEAESGKILPVLVNELAEKNLDLSVLTGIPGTLGGAVFGNAGQGVSGIWIDSFIESVTVYYQGKWRKMNKEECNFRYRESWFKDVSDNYFPPIIWSVNLKLPKKPSAEIKKEIDRLLQKRIASQPHIKTAGSCFKSLPDGTPAWKIIDKAGLRGLQIGDIQISEKHANFLLNVNEANFDDLQSVIKKIKTEAPEIAGMEMRLFGCDGKTVI